MYSHPTAIVIGAGLGGIATAARLARAGYQVTVLEKNATPGGRCGQLIRNGHRFDIGATLFLMPDVFAQTYADLGERMEDHLDLRRIDPTYRIHFADDTALALTNNLNDMQAQLEAIEPGSFGGLLRYLVKHYGNIGHYFQHPQLKAAFTFQNMYLGLSPFDAPATYSLLQYTELADGVWFPMGGLYRVIESLASIARAHGVEFWYRSPVKQIKVAGNRATGVVLQNGARLGADVIVANADLPYVYRDLLPDQGEADRLERLKYTCSAIMFYWGTDQVYPQLGHHNIFLAGDYRGSFDRIFQDYTLPDEPSFYVHAPARTDPAAAPAGHDTLFVLVPVGHLDDARPQDWDALKAKARSTVLDRLSRLGLSDLEQHLKLEVSTTPVNWLDRFNLAKGAAFGLSHNFWQVGYLRPQNRHRRYRNLYFAGSSTHPGTGLPMVLLSARLTTQRILSESGQPRPVMVMNPLPA